MNVVLSYLIFSGLIFGMIVAFYLALKIIKLI